MTSPTKDGRVGVGTAIVRFVQRLYALGFLVLIVFVCYRVFRYLLVSLVVSGGPPEQVTGLPTKLDERALRLGRTAFPGIDATPQSRGPLSHYHGLDGWFQPDPHDDCTTSGCHGPLPHSQRKELRAFLNMHATSIHCGVCHLESSERPMAVMWYSLATGGPSETPALLRAYEIVSNPQKLDEPASREELIALMQQAADASDHLRGLQDLADHFASASITSEAFDQLVSETERTISRHFRGEYGAKIARRTPGGGPMLAHPDIEQAKREFFNPTEGNSSRARVLAALHPLRAERPLDCADCHGQTDLAIDLNALGYPAKRVNALRDPMIVRMIEHIAAGQKFYMPGFARPDGDRSGGSEGGNQ